MNTMEHQGRGAPGTGPHAAERARDARYRGERNGRLSAERMRFARCREAVSAEAAAARYGMAIDRSGRALCPVHNDHHPSVSFHDGRWRCWACGAGGDSIDLTAKLLHLTPGQALRRLNEDFDLGLSPGRPPSAAERRRAMEWERRQAEARRFVDWRAATLNRLSAAIYAGNLAGKQQRALTEREATALRQKAYLEWLSDELEAGPPEQQHGMYDRREEIESLCAKVLDGAT